MQLFRNDLDDTWYWITTDEDVPMSPAFDDAYSAQDWWKQIQEELYQNSVQVPRNKEQAAIMLRLAQMYFEGNP